LNQLVDFRPYSNEDPMTVVPTNTMLKCCELFRKMHLRHLPVIDRFSGKVVGMITRQDLFMWMDL
jgi:CBS domain-containing protein